MSLFVRAVFILVVSAASISLADTAPSTRPAAINSAIDRGVKFLEGFQNPDGSWGTGTETRGSEIFSMVPGSHDAFRIGTSALCVLALREAGETKAHDKGLEYLLTSEDARRDDGILLYNTWAHIYIVHTLAIEMRYSKDRRIAQVLKRNIKEMMDYATFMGGWAYYDFDYHTQSPSSGPTSFGTAAGLVSLWEAKQSGVEGPAKLVAQSIKRLEEMRLPNGVYLYGTDYKYVPRIPGNLPRGAAGRTQPANYALWLWHSPKVDATRNREGLDIFFKEHAFLDNGRKHLFPHEALYQISGYYYYFDHYYASRLLESLTDEQMKEYGPKIADCVLPHQEEDGSWWDYPMWDYHKPYGTAFAIMTLLRCK